jgi:hypothetical protein
MKRLLPASIAALLALTLTQCGTDSTSPPDDTEIGGSPGDASVGGGGGAGKGGAAGIDGSIGGGGAGGKTGSGGSSAGGGDSGVTIADEPVDGTSGLPLGGIGTGAVKFRAHDGTFAVSETSPCARDDFQTVAGMALRFFSSRGGSSKTSDRLVATTANGRARDDAIYPIHMVDFGSINGVGVTLTASSPFDLQNVDAMTYPAALFQLTLTNTQSSAVDASVGFQVETSAAPQAHGTGFSGGSGVQRAVYAASGDAGAVISVGNDAGFAQTGVLGGSVSGNVNTVAAKVSLAANEVKTVRFVYAWYNAGDATRYYYTKAFADASAVAQAALSQFDALQSHATELVGRMRAGTLPSWLKNETLNTLVNLTNNSIYTQDGRYCHTEGEWNINGTMDQMWHARQIYTQLVPSLVWQELKFWARTQKTSPAGQIHHDFGTPASALVAWDDQQHGDYRNIDAWVDLNAAFIISLYEAYAATADRQSLDALWPYAKKAGQRILDQASQFPSTQYPGTFQGSQNSYDAGGDPDPYNSGIALVAYLLLIDLGNVEGDTSLNPSLQSALTLGKSGFQQRYLTQNLPTGVRAEATMSGQWLAYFLKLGELFPTSGIDYAMGKLKASLNPGTAGVGSPGGTYSEWEPYMLSHYGGLLLQTGNADDWRSMQFDAYERAYLDRNRVFNQPLDILAKVTTPKYTATDFSAYKHYISTPVIWRNYYDLIGYQRDKTSGSLWLEPSLPTEVNHSIASALVVSPDGYGSIDYSESGAQMRERRWTVRFDQAISVSALHLSDRGGTAYVSVDGQAQTVSRSGAGHAAQLDIAWSGTIGPQGVVIVTSESTIP